MYLSIIWSDSGSFAKLAPSSKEIYPSSQTRTNKHRFCNNVQTSGDEDYIHQQQQDKHTSSVYIQAQLALYRIVVW